jgi:iron(III) transport system permease protein
MGRSAPAERRWPWLQVSGGSGRASLLWLALAGLLAFLVLYPIAWLVLESIRSETGSFTLAHYRAAATSPAFRIPALNSFILAACTGVLSVLIATPMAWAIARTDMPLRRLVRILVFGSIVTPGMLTALAWIILAGPNAGALNRLFRTLTHGTGGANIFSLPGLIFVAVLECYPFAFLLISGALSLVSVDMEDAANILGSDTRRTLFYITLPLVLPAVLAGFILSFLEALTLFSSPAMIGIPSRIFTLTTEIWSLFEFPRRVGVAAALALPLLLVTVALLWLQARLLGRRGYITLTGKGGARRLIRLGWVRWPMLAFCLLVLACSVVLPYFVLFAYATARSWGEPLGAANLTLDHFRAVLFSNTAAQRAIRNSTVLALSAATVASALGALVAYVAERRLLPGGPALRGLAMAPMVIPGIVFAVGLFAGYTRAPLQLYGTLWILFIAYLTKFLPYAYMNTAAAVKAVHPELEEAARIAGAGALGAFRDVTAPLIRLGALAGWFIVFIYSLRELSASILLFTNATTVIGVTILDLYEFGSWPGVSALGCMLLVVNLAVIGVGYRLVGTNFLGGTRE